jgi:hypothetical protein
MEKQWLEDIGLEAGRNRDLWQTLMMRESSRDSMTGSIGSRPRRRCI